MLDVSLMRKPHGLVNPAVLERPGFQQKWQRLCGAARANKPAHVKKRSR
jgi:hypothetical protein